MLVTSTRLERLLFFGGGICLIYPGIITDILGLGSVCLGLALQLVRRKKLPVPEQTPEIETSQS